MKKYVWLLVVVALLSALLYLKKDNMTWRQSLLKAAYPLIMLKGKLTGVSKEIKLNPHTATPGQSFYALQAASNRGDSIGFEQFRGKKVLIVNTASDCGYTGQYAELEKLYQAHKDKLVVLGFPANDFKQQEKKSDAEIAQFCQINYGVSFPLFQKSVVLAKAQQNQVFQWLTQRDKNGWNTQVPTWNFSKYLVNEKGELEAFFSQNVSPLDPALTKFLE